MKILFINVCYVLRKLKEGEKPQNHNKISIIISQTSFIITTFTSHIFIEISFYRVLQYFLHNSSIPSRVEVIARIGTKRPAGVQCLCLFLDGEGGGAGEGSSVNSTQNSTRTFCQALPLEYLKHTKVSIAARLWREAV